MYRIDKIRCNALIYLILMLCLISCHGGFAGLPHAEPSTIVNDKEELTALAQEIAQRDEMDISNCDIEVRKEGEFVVVSFLEKHVHVQVGGGVEFYFKKENGKYTFVKGILGQ